MQSMPEYLHPGVFVQEIASGVQAIEGVATTTAAFIGAAERGPLRPCLVHSLSEYGQHFGGTSVDGFLPLAVRGFYENGGGRLFVCRTTPDTRTAGVDLGDWSIRAVGPGAWGRRVWLTVGPGSTLRADGSPVGFRVRAAYFAPDREIYDPFSAANATRMPRPQYLEDFDDVRIEDFSPDHIDSVLITVSRDTASPALAPPPFNGLLDEVAADATPVPQGLAALIDPICDEVSLVYAPAADESLQRAIVAFCQQRPNRFAILDVARGITDLSSLHPRTTIADSAFAALYAPWLRIADASGAPMTAPPGGHVAGMIVRVDRERGVHKAPANEILKGVLGLETAIDDRLQQELNPRGINAIREFPEHGIRVWGARTLSSDSEWKYVNVRRYFIFLELSVYLGTQWAVFERNDEALWTRVREVLRAFLYSQWRAGALLGDREETAFFVHCGRDTMTQADIDMGRLIIEIGCAPLRPAEFIVLRFEHHIA